MTKTKLKIGLLIGSYSIANWQFKIIEELKNSGFAEINLVIKNAAPAIKRTSGFSGFYNNTGNIIFNTHLKLDEYILGRDTDYSKKINSKILLNGISEVAAMPIENGYAAKLSKDDIKEIRSFDLDIILKLGGGRLAGDILTIPKYGVWSYGAGGNNINGVDPLGYWEVVKKIGTTDSMLQILSEGSDTRVIHCSRILTNFTSISKNRNLCYWRAFTIIGGIIEGLYNFGEPYFLKLESKHKNKANFYDGELKKSPLPFIALKNVFIHFWKVNKRLLQKLFFIDHWDVLYKIDSKEMFISSLSDFKLLPTPNDRFWTDPFVISRDDRHFIFVEELIYKTNKGHIVVVEIDNYGNVVGSKKVLERTYHLSYPFLLKVDDSYYMIPETGENKTIEIYKCTEFPYKWEFVMNLMEGIRTADATLFYYNNKWWLFCCIDKTGIHEGLLDELYLFYSDNLFTTNWQSHPCNPINTDTRTARPAGKIFIKNDKIYRPSQDSSGIYGRGINLNEIVKLSETEYEEVVIKKVVPEGDSGLFGTHTFNTDGKITVIDGFKYKRRIK